MADIWTKRKRSEVMRLIRSQGNKATELRLIEVFQTYRITGWRRKQKLLGNPDFVFQKDRTCIFVDGCFWHGCPKCYRRPRSHQEYWDAKIQRNRKRDLLVTRELRRGGWRVLRILEHQLSEKNKGRLLHRIHRALEIASRNSH